MDRKIHKAFEIVLMKRLAVLALLLCFCQCSIDRTILPISTTERAQLTEFRQLESKSRLIISGEEEPGIRLLLCLTFVNKANKKELPNQEVAFYHTSNSGEYEQSDPNDESTARLYGLANTDSMGRIYIETILPGDYGSSDDNRHIHTTVAGAKPEAYDINFSQYSGYMSKRFIEDSDQHFLVDLRSVQENQLIGFLTIEVKRPKE